MKYPYFDQLLQEVKEGWIDVNKHPSLPLSIYNYSRKTQFENSWNSVRLQCRGLVLDNQGEVIAWCFPKFFNYEEIRYKNEIPFGEIPIIQNKEDGSLGIIFYYNNEWHVATRGSFFSEQAIKGKEIFYKNYNVDKLNKNYTYLVEIIYPENRIVVDYKDQEKLIWLSTVAHNGNELPVREFLTHIIYDVNIPKTDIINHGHIHVNSTSNYNFFDENLFQTLKSQYKENTEGFVVRFEPSNYRLKIKFEEYVRLHKLLTGITSVDIWECLKNGDSIDKILENVPDEFDSWVKQQIKKITDQAVKIGSITADLLDDMYNQVGYEASRKEYALWIQQNVKPRYQGVVFTRLDRKSYYQYIWKLIKPTNKKAFWNYEKI